MEMVTGLEELSACGLLDHAAKVATMQRRCEAQTLRIALQHAISNNPDTLDPQLTKLPGRERAIRYGGVGTENVAEFAAADLGARLGVSPWSAHALMADALDLVIRLPLLWARVEALEVKASYARYVARRTRDLTIEQAAHVDERVVESADGRIPWSRFEELVAAAIVAADTWAARCREDEEAKRQLAKPTRSTEDGMRGFYIRAPFAVIARFDATVQHLADLLAERGDTDDNDHRRVKAILLLANPAAAVQLLTTATAPNPEPADPKPPEDEPAEDQPAKDEPAEDDGVEVDWSKLLPAVTIFVHMYFGTPDKPSEGVARVEGVGPVTEAYLSQHLCRAANVTVVPVLDLAGQAPVDGYEVPDAHRRAVHLMSPADVFPFAPNTTRDKQIDHTVPYAPNAPPGAGQSRIGNYGPMTPFHHRVKTHGNWEVQQPFPGIYIWRDPHGAYYLIDHTGSRRIGRAA